MRNFVYGGNVKSPAVIMLNAIFGGAQVFEPQFLQISTDSSSFFCLVMRTYTASLFRFLQPDIHHSEVKSIDEMIEKISRFTCRHRVVICMKGIRSLIESKKNKLQNLIGNLIEFFSD